MHVVPQLLVSTILLGGIYALIAVGLTLIFGVMRVVNFAHGEFLMLGMYLAFWAFALLRLDPYVTLVLSLPLVFGFGWLSYRMVMRPVIHASHNVQVFTTVGLSIVLQNVALVLWSADSQFVRTSYYTVVVRLGSAVLNLAQLIAFAVAVLCTAALFAFMRWSYTGKVMRATAQDRAAASLMGIDTGRVFALTWAVGVTCVGVAGVLLAPIYPVYPTVGLQFVLIAYVAVVLGGLGDMAGALIASLIVAAVEVIGSYVIGTAWKEVLYLLLVHRDSRGSPRRALRPARRRGDRHMKGTWPAVVFFAARRPRAGRRARRLPPRQPRPHPAMGCDGRGLERGRRLRGPGLARPRGVLRAGRVLRGAARDEVGAVAVDRAARRRRPGHGLRDPHRLPQQPAARSRTSSSPRSRSRRCC